MYTIMKVKEELNEPAIFTFADLRSCFDRNRLQDVVYNIADAGADLKALKVAHDLARETHIKIAGDPRQERSAVVMDTTGQGTSLAPKATSLSVGKTTDQSVSLEDCVKIGDINVPPRVFVDDNGIPNKDEDAARRNGEAFSRAIDLLSLEANSTKSSVVVCGGNNLKVKRSRQDLTENPVKFQGQEVGVKESDQYLGVNINQEGFNASVKTTIKQRINRAWNRAANIKSVINLGG